MVGVATMVRCGVRIPAEGGNFLFSIFQNCCGTDAASSAEGSGVLRVKQPALQVNNSPPSFFDIRGTAHR